jgi:tRNA 2-thiouridine synthesizing protein A
MFAAGDLMAEHVMDLRGLRCPLPVLKAKKLMRTLAAGDRLVLECTDPMTVIDIPHFARQDGHVLELQEQRGEIYVYAITKAG